jgi:DNA-binding MarR family transcriptional regulator
MVRESAETYARGTDGLLYDAALRESATKLHALFPELDPLVFEAFVGLGNTWNAVRKLGAKYHAALGLTANQLSTLRFLLEAEGSRLTIGDIAGRSATSSMNVTKLIDRMQRAGLVRRVRDAEDGRVTWVVLTRAGRQRYIEAMPSSSLDREAFGVLSERQLKLLVDMLTRVRQKAGQLQEAAESGALSNDPGRAAHLHDAR